MDKKTNTETVQSLSDSLDPPRGCIELDFDFKGGIAYEFGPDNGEPSSFGSDDFSVEAWINVPAPDLAVFRFGPDGGRIGRFRWSNKTELQWGRCWWEQN